MERRILVKATQRGLRYDLRFYSGETLVFATQDRPLSAQSVVTVSRSEHAAPLIEKRGTDNVTLSTTDLAIIPEGSRWHYNLWLEQDGTRGLVRHGAFTALASVVPQGTGDPVDPPDPLAITGTPATTATVGTAYAFAPVVTGGTMPYSFALSGGSLPAGLSLDQSTGAITGTPQSPVTSQGLVLTVSDADSQAASLPAFAIAVEADDPPAPGTVLLIVAGQSNSRAAGNSAGTPPARYTASAFGDMAIFERGSGANVLAEIAAGDFQPYDITSNADPDNSGTAWGSEAEFVYRMRQSGDTRPVRIVKESQNGQNLFNDWNPSTSNDNFAHLEAKVAQARALVPEDFSEEIILWNQGEADANEDTHAAAYAANWTAFLTQFRTRISTGFFIAERIRPLGYEGGSVTNSSAGFLRAWTVREATLAGVLADGNATAVDTDFDPNTFNSIHPLEPWTEGKATRAFAAYSGNYDALYGSIFDTTPDPFAVADVGDATPSDVITSESVLITGIERQTPVTVSGGTFRTLNTLDADAVVSDWATSGVVDKFQLIQLRCTAAATEGTTTPVTLTVGGVSETWSVTTFMTVPSFEPETDSFIARVATNGGGTISGPDAIALNTFYQAAKTSTWWPRIIRLFLRLGDETASRLDLRGASYAMMDSGALASNNWAWTASSGWTGQDNSNGSLDLGVNPSVDMPQNDSSFGAWYSALATNTRGDIKGDAGDVFLRFTDAGSSRYLLHSSGNTNASGLPTAPGLRAVVRDGAASLRLHGADGSIIHNAATGSSAPLDTVLDIGARLGTYSDASVLGAFVGNAALSEAEMQNLATAAQALLDHFSS